MAKFWYVFANVGIGKTSAPQIASIYLGTQEKTPPNQKEIMRVLSDHKSLESPFQSFLMFNRIQTHTHMYIYICLQAWISLILAGTIMYASVD